MGFINERNLLICFFLFPGIVLGQNYTVKSPDKKVTINVTVKDDVKWSVTYNSDEVLLAPSRIALEFKGGKTLGNNPAVTKTRPSSVTTVIEAPVAIKNKRIPEEYNQLKVQFKGSFAITFRAYNDGAAYRFETSLPDKELLVKNEIAEFNFPDNYQTAWPIDEPFSFAAMRPALPIAPGFGSANPPSGNFGMFGPPPSQANNNNKGPDVNVQPPPGPGGPGGFPRLVQSPFTTSYEYLFRDSTVAMVRDTIGLPIYFSTRKGTKIVLTEADLYDYPNLFAKGKQGNGIEATFPPYIIKEGGGFMGMSPPAETADYIAKTTGTRTYPWRALVISPDDKGLLENELVYKLSSPPVIPTDWIQPGQVAWEWWHASNLFDVDFRAGINTRSYQYYIDFASRYGVKYILIDAGWSNNPDVNIPEITKYAGGKNVGVMLWISWTDLTSGMDSILNRFQQWGVKGVKMDYMNRADQKMVNIFERVAQETAKRKMLIDYHGAYKPTGLHRKYPNVVNYEGVKGLEHNKLGSKRITPSHDIAIMFTRMVAGPIDYTPGAMYNATSANFRNIASAPMSQGTRAHQTAMYILYDAPIQMLADNPVLYMREDAYTKFITQIPTVWDKTIGVDGMIGRYAVLARKKDNNWYLGALNDWTNRNLDVSLNFLDAKKKYKLTIVQDGINADNYASDYKITSQEVSSSDKVKITMARGGGWAAILTPVE